MAKSKYDRPVTHSDSYKYLQMQSKEDARKHAEKVNSLKSKEEVKKGRTVYTVEIFKASYVQAGHAEAQGQKDLAATKAHLRQNMKRGSYRFKVYNKRTGKEVGG